MNDASSPQPHIRLHDIQREEKKFLMRVWCQQLLTLLEGSESLDNLAKRALLTARAHVDAPMADRIDALLVDHEPISDEDAAQEDILFSGDSSLFGVATDDLSDNLFETESPAPSPTFSGRVLSQQSPKSPKSCSSFSEENSTEEIPGFTPSVESPKEETPRSIQTQGDRKEKTIDEGEKQQKKKKTSGTSSGEPPGKTDLWVFEEEEDDSGEKTTEALSAGDENLLSPVDTPPLQTLNTENSSSDLENDALFPVEQELSLQYLEEQEGRQKEAPAEAKSEQETTVNSLDEKRLSLLPHLIRLDQLEKHLGLQIIPEDRLLLEQQLIKKMRDPAICHLMNHAKEKSFSLVMVPRIQRAFFDGKILHITGTNLLRLYPKFFENIQQTALKMSAETHFLQETPQMGWGLTTAEVLTESHNTNYFQQEQVLKRHAQSHKSNEMRVRRRTLIEALFDLLAVKIVTGKQLLYTTVDLTESKMGRVNMAVINYGESGIRIGDINSQQTHPQLGVCPTW